MENNLHAKWMGIYIKWRIRWLVTHSGYDKNNSSDQAVYAGVSHSR